MSCFFQLWFALLFGWDHPKKFVLNTDCVLFKPIKEKHLLLTDMKLLKYILSNLNKVLVLKRMLKKAWNKKVMCATCFMLYRFFYVFMKL